MTEAAEDMMTASVAVDKSALLQRASNGSNGVKIGQQHQRHQQQLSSI